jgi:hypothetical protein
MSLPLILTSEAEAGRAEAKGWYEAKREGLGEAFAVGFHYAPGFLACGHAFVQLFKYRLAASAEFLEPVKRAAPWSSNSRHGCHIQRYTSLGHAL